MNRDRIGYFGHSRFFKKHDQLYIITILNWSHSFFWKTRRPAFLTTKQRRQFLSLCCGGGYWNRRGGRGEKKGLLRTPTLSWGMSFINKTVKTQPKRARNKMHAGCSKSTGGRKNSSLGELGKSFPEEVMSDLCQKRWAGVSQAGKGAGKGGDHGAMVQGEAGW